MQNIEPKKYHFKHWIQINSFKRWLKISQKSITIFYQLFTLAIWKQIESLQFYSLKFHICWLSVHQEDGFHEPLVNVTRPIASDQESDYSSVGLYTPGGNSSTCWDPSVRRIRSVYQWYRNHKHRLCQADLHGYFHVCKMPSI